MNIRDLEYFVALTKLKHFNKAAQHCHVSQPTLSMQIKKLETYLGLPCFERGAKTVFLTDFGHKIYPVIEQVLNQVKTIEAIAQDFADPFQSNVVMGAVHTIAPYLLPEVVKNLHNHYPQMKIQLIENKTQDLVNKLKIGAVELIFLATKELGMECLPLLKDELYVLVPKSHPLSKKSSIRNEDLESQPMILLEPDHCLAELVFKKCVELKCVVNDFRATSLETLRAMVIANQGLTIIPKVAIREEEKLCYIPFEMPFYRTLYACYRPETPRQETLLKIYEQIKNEYANY